MNLIKTSRVILGIGGGLGIVLLAQLLSQLAAGVLLVVQIPVFLCNIAAAILYIAFGFWMLRAFCRRVLRCGLGDCFIPCVCIRMKWLAVALLLPVSVTVLYLLLPGQMVDSGMDTRQVLETVSAGVFFTGLGAGIVEEMVFRGLIMSLILRRWGKTAAIFIPSVLFGLVHIIGMDFSFLSALQVVLAGTAVGVMFSLIALERCSVWNSAMVHALWNMVIIGGILSIGVEASPYSIYSYVLETGNFAVTGGQFGIESSVIAIAGYGVVSVLAYMGMRKRTKV